MGPAGREIERQPAAPLSDDVLHAHRQRRQRHVRERRAAGPAPACCRLDSAHRGKLAATKIPEAGGIRRSLRPSASRRRASRCCATPSCSDSRRDDGSRAPGRMRAARMASRSWSTSWLVRVSRRERSSSTGICMRSKHCRGCAVIARPGRAILGRRLDHFKAAAQLVPANPPPTGLIAAQQAGLPKAEQRLHESETRTAPLGISAPRRRCGRCRCHRIFQPWLSVRAPERGMLSHSRSGRGLGRASRSARRFEWRELS